MRLACVQCYWKCVREGARGEMVRTLEEVRWLPSRTFRRTSAPPATGGPAAPCAQPGPALTHPLTHPVAAQVRADGKQRLSSLKKAKAAVAKAASADAKKQEKAERALAKAKVIRCSLPDRVLGRNG